MVFKKYAQYYDLLYKDKNYTAEVDYVTALIEKYNPKSEKVLEFGSGSGIHGMILANKGFKVSGIERSQDMIDLGLSSTFSKKQNNIFSCIQGDCTETYLGDDFDAAISLFHVLSYQTTNKSVQGMLRNAHRQLKQGGVFILDYWHAPAVWNIIPCLRVKRVKDENLAITRIAEPECIKKKNIVKVHYQTFVEDLKTKNITENKETHVMRAFEEDEIIAFCKKTGFNLIVSMESMMDNQPTNKTWGVCSVLQKV